ncbi:response regulator [Maridesulfovibrio hydrothermalis]|uniref:Response regulator receiver protein n=1 Tax=Maridesulfovibrio hydrothermalis AM13 = DSM 14728 TaxID=1121451 RepID=L0R7Z0_9BACT|nr:response regulator [Maridesulfovibrio hydrothermalis]CCO22347.1 Response regulator receiver protein [Maridesulfovibrio hydrothermalis AM13 = DSM 14728]
MSNKEISEMKLLVAEDSRPVMLVLKTYIKQLGIEPEYAESGTVAFDKLSSNKFDLAFMDVHMPEMDGREVVSRVREDGTTIPIIAMTTGDDPELLVSCLDAGYNSFLLKPIQKDELTQIIIKFHKKMN